MRSFYKVNDIENLCKEPNRSFISPLETRFGAIQKQANKPMILNNSKVIVTGADIKDSPDFKK